MSPTDPRVVAATSASAFGETPVSGIVLSRARLLASIPVASITRDEDELPLSRDTYRDARPLIDSVPEEHAVPATASEYVPPQPLPCAAQHKTFELRPVRLDPAVHPRTAPTVLNVRSQKRRYDKQQKDAREFDALVAQSHRRRRGPWLTVAFVSVVGLGFLVGTELMDSSQAGAETKHPSLAQQPLLPGAAAPEKSIRASEPSGQASKAHGLQSSAEPGPAQNDESEPTEVPQLEAPHKALEHRATAAVRRTQAQRTAAPAPLQSRATTEGSRAKSLPSAAPSPGRAAPKPVREVWLK